MKIKQVSSQMWEETIYFIYLWWWGVRKVDMVMKKEEETQMKKSQVLDAVALMLQKSEESIQIIASFTFISTSLPGV